MKEIPSESVLSDSVSFVMLTNDVDIDLWLRKLIRGPAE